MIKFWKWTVYSQEEANALHSRVFQAQSEAEVAKELGRKEGFNEGVNHLFDQISMTIHQNNPNRLFATSFLSRDQMVFLFKAITGSFVRGNKSI